MLARSYPDDMTSPSRRGEPVHAFTGITDQNQLNPMFARDGEATDFPLNTLPSGESLPETAYQIVHDEAMLDGNSRLNLATFVGTWMDPHADRLYSETVDKNMVDKDEYPQTAAIEDAVLEDDRQSLERPGRRERRSGRRRSAHPRRACSAGSH